MERTQSYQRNLVWIDGDTLVRRVGEAESHDYLFGSGYQAKLTNFIKEREARLKQEEAELQARRNARNKKVVLDAEPEM